MNISESKDFLVSSASLKEVRTFSRDVFNKIELPQDQKDELVLAIAEAAQNIVKHGYKGVNFNSPAFYAVSKAGVIHLTKYLATYWAKKNVRVNCISPAGVYQNHDLSFVKKLSEQIPMGRMALPNEFKGAIVFLASNASSFVTGHNLLIDGGRTIW